MQNMKIAIDSGPLASGHKVRGIGTYVRELTKELKGVDVVDFSTKLKLSEFNIIHFTSFKPFEVSLPFSKPRGAKYVLTIYDLIPLIYPKHYPPGIRGWAKWRTNKYLIKKNIDAIITISETSKKDICRFIGIDPRKVFVTYLAPRPIFKKLEVGSWKLEVLKQYSLPNRFALYVGDINYNKNIPTLVAACKTAKIPLVIAGKQAEEIESLDFDHPELRHLKGIDWNGVKRLGFVSDEDLVKIYNLATVYVQPSYYEGFGLPILEALSCKTPLAVSKNQCHVEILGEDFSYFDPKSVDSVADALKNPNIGKKLPRNYSWKKTATKTQEIYAKI